jgi:hypothetical protein
MLPLSPGSSRATPKPGKSSLAKIPPKVKLLPALKLPEIYCPKPPAENGAPAAVPKSASIKLL